MSYFNNLNSYEPWMQGIYRVVFDESWIKSAQGYVVPKGILIHYYYATYRGTGYPCMAPPKNGKIVKHIAYATEILKKVTCPRCRVWLRDNVMLPRMRANKIVDASGEKP